MSEYAIYGKRIGLKVNGIETFDKTFRALNYQGVRVNKLTDAGTYATKEDAQEVINKKCQEYIDQKLVLYEIRKIR